MAGDEVADDIGGDGHRRQRGGRRDHAVDDDGYRGGGATDDEAGEGRDLQAAKRRQQGAGVVVAPAGHPLARRRSVTLPDVARYRLLLPPRGTAFRADLDAAAATAGTSLQPEAELDGVRLTASMVFQGYGVAVLPATAVSSWQATDRWRAVPLKDLPPRQVGVVQRRRGLPSAPARALLEILRDTVAGEGERQHGVRLISPC